MSTISTDSTDRLKSGITNLRQQLKSRFQLLSNKVCIDKHSGNIKNEAALDLPDSRNKDNALRININDVMRTTDLPSLAAKATAGKL